MNDNSDDAKKYEDMLDMPHHVSSTRPHMSMDERAAQFSPFAALTGYDAAIGESARLTDEKVVPGEDAKAALDEKLLLLFRRQKECPAVTITYFMPDERKAGGAYVRASGRVRKVDAGLLILIYTDGRRIPFADIVEIDGDIFTEPLE